MAKFIVIPCKNEVRMYNKTENNTNTEVLVYRYIKSFPDSSVGKESIYNAGDPCSIPGLGRSPGEGIGYPLLYSSASLVAQLVKKPPAIWETWV